jgi:hypothetical protein
MPEPEVRRMVPQPQSLLDLAASVKKRHAMITGSSMQIVQMAIDNGEELLKIKAQIGHGGFLKWIAHHCQITDKTAERYMKFAQNKDKLKAAMDKAKIETISDLTLKQAERLIDGGENPKPKKTPLDKIEAAWDKLELSDRQAFVEIKSSELGFLMKEVDRKERLAA